MLNKLINVFRIPELRKKVIFTFLCLIVYRLGMWLQVPGADVGKILDAKAAEGAFTYQPVAGGTRVVWRDQGRMSGFTGRYMVPMLERVLAEQFGQGLDRLKRQVESAPPDPD